MVEILSAFPARPPTPPRASHVLFNQDGDRPQGRSNVFNTPGESPSSTAESTILRSSKKVNFSPITSYIKPSSSSNPAPVSNNGVRSIPPSNECKPAKSILKTTSSTVPDPAEENQPQSFAMLLESTMQQLAGESLSSRVDAYMHLLGASKAYENIPEQSAMVSKVGLLAQFIQRDISRDFGKGEVVELNLVTNALKLGIYIIWNQALCSHLPDDFRIFIVDHSLGALQDGKYPKAVLNHYAHVLYTQNFSPKIMTNSRITRILAVLNDVTDRVNGNGIISQRIGVYTRLITQSKTVMASQASLWIQNLISGLLHPIKDTRSKALALGNQVAVLLGPNLNVSKAILDLFNKELSQGRKLVSEICERMSRMMSSIDSGVHVPQIWSIIVLLLRSKRFNIEQWEYFKEWVLVLQKCFNCSEPAIKAQAILGWNRFVYVITCNDSTSNSMMKMLTKPIISQFERRKNEKSSIAVNPVILSSYYNLLYYAFRPSAPHEHTDFIWEEYINQPLINIFTTSPQLNDSACKALASLLWSPQPKVWVENKINEVSRMDPEHILPIDCRWTRSRIVLILKAFEVLFSTATWAPGNDTVSDISIAWTNLCKALTEASSKEIKASAELMQAVASILDLFQRLHHGAPASLNAKTNDEFLERFFFLSTTVITAIGSPFTEKILLKTAHETFQAANTPTHRGTHTDINLDTPFMHILRMLSSSGDLSEPRDSHLNSVDSLMEAAFRGRQSRGSRLEFLEKCTQLQLRESDVSPVLNRCIWEATARLTINCLNSFPMEIIRDRDGSLSRDYDNVTKILVRGSQFATAFQTWSSLLDACVRTVRTERGERGIATLIIEPIATKFLELTSDMSYRPLKALINQALSLPYYQQNEVSPLLACFSRGSPASNQAFFPDKLLEFIAKVMTESYEQFNPGESQAMAEVIESLTSLLGSGVSQFRSKLLEKLQSPLSLWLQDSARCLTSEKGSDSRLLTACRKLSWAIAYVLQTTVQHDQDSLRLFEAIVSAGLESAHKSTANRFIEMWNSTFGLQVSVTYPPAVEAALQKLEPFVELRLPCPLPSQSNSQDYEMPNLVESQNTDSSFDLAQELMRNSLKNKTHKKLRPTALSSSPIVQSAELDKDSLPKRRADITPRRRLRHDDSQIQFVAVESSPIASDIESQLLTERQREVKERQRGNSAIFFEGLRSSSPTLPSPAKETGILTPVQLPDLRESERNPDVLLTPTLAANLQENDDDFPGSSPTPGAKDRTAFQPQKASALAIESMDTLQPDPVSSPEAQSRSPRRRRGKRKSSALRSSESYALDARSQAEKGSERRRSTRNSTVQSSEHEAGNMAAQENQPEQLKEQPSESNNPPDMEDAPVDVIPDTYSDEFEIQLASQLGQDLELAVDLHDTERSQLDSGNSPAGPITRKRKRETDADVGQFVMPSRRKRRSLRKSQIADTEENVENTSKEENAPTRSPARQPEITAEDAKVRTPQTSPFKNKKSSNATPDNTTSSGSRRRSRRLNANDVPDLASSPAQVEPPTFKRRKSLRLNGEASPPANASKSASATPRSQQKHSRSDTADQSTATPSIRSSARKTRLSEIATHKSSEKVGSNMNNLETEMPSTLETSDAVIEAATGDQPRTQHSISRVEEYIDVSMENAANSMPLTNSNRESTENYVSHAAQTDSGVDDNEAQGNSIINSLRKVLNDIKGVTFGRAVLREIDDLMFDIRVEAVKRGQV